uniref:Ubiquitin-like protease family profile domain-containing protein n=1 Tax=Xenopus tropicalis TaxID=8364 RepID=A0A803K8S3_XENTR
MVLLYLDLIYHQIKNPEMFMGVFPCDLLPRHKVQQKPAAYIVNTDNSQQRGHHWVLIILCDNKNSIFFDSYGLSPENVVFPKDFIQFLKRNSTRITYQNRQLQDTVSSYCGHYCIFMLHHIARGVSYKKCIKIL